jgi:uncharacterized protein YjbI with pentapeptide repeats
MSKSKTKTTALRALTDADLAAMTLTDADLAGMALTGADLSAMTVTADFKAEFDCLKREHKKLDRLFCELLADLARTPRMQCAEMWDPTGDFMSRHDKIAAERARLMERFDRLVLALKNQNAQGAIQ